MMFDLIWMEMIYLIFNILSNNHGRRLGWEQSKEKRHDWASLWDVRSTQAGSIGKLHQRGFEPSPVDQENATTIQWLIGHLQECTNNEMKTLVKKILQMRAEGIEEAEFKHLEKDYGGLIKELNVLVPKMVDKVALIFCETSIFDLKKKIEANKVPTEARVGVQAPIDFVVPAGPTGLDPSQINFFHALNISTKIVKAQIDITKDFKVCTVGKRVKASEAALLKKLNLKPFSYGMKIIGVYNDGSILPESVINIDSSALLGRFQDGIKNIAGLSLSAGYPIEATVPIILANSFKNIAALSMESGYP